VCVCERERERERERVQGHCFLALCRDHESDGGGGLAHQEVRDLLGSQAQD